MLQEKGTDTMQLAVLLHGLKETQLSIADS